MATRRIQPIKDGGLRDQVKKAIRVAIVQGNFLPGDPVRELDLARDLRVSQATVRESLLQLEHVGLVVRVPNKETVIVNLTRQELQDRIAIRILLESSAASQAATRMSVADFRELDQRLSAISRAAKRNEYIELSQADLAFHSAIWNFSGNATLVHILENLTSPMFTFVGILHHSEIGDLSAMVHAHEPIVAAMRSGEPSAVGASIRAHVEGSYEGFLSSNCEDLRTMALAQQVALGKTNGVESGGRLSGHRLD